MKILHVIRGLTNSSGTTHIVGPLAEEQARLGHDVSVYFVEKPPFEAVVPTHERVEVRSFPVTMLRGHPGVSVPFARAIDQNIRTFDIVHVHAVWNFPSFYAMRAALRAGVPFIVAPQGSLEPWALAAGSRARRAYAAHIEGPLIRRASGMQALTENEARQFEHFGFRGPISIVPNGVSADWLALERASLVEELNLGPGSRTVLFLSRVHKKKGLSVLLNAFAAFAAGDSTTFLIVAGDDAGSGHLEEIQRLAHDLKIAERCRFIGEVSGFQKRRILAGADVFALTSHSEGLPIALLEAMAAGLPVVATTGCNLPEIQSYDAGRVVDPKPDAVAAALREMLARPDDLRRQGENGRRLVAAKFTWPRIASNTIAAYAPMREGKAA